MSVLETVRYCSIFNFGEVAGFNCNLERLKLGEGALAMEDTTEICGDNLGGLSDSLFLDSLLMETGVIMLIGWLSTLEGIRFISYKQSCHEYEIHSFYRFYTF